jgi:ABC-type nitrate/sulfonate/bicarbonate transport system substrate-binding protein
MNRLLARLIGSLTVGCLGLTLSMGALAHCTEKIKVRMDWTPWSVQAAMHLAQQKGWFAALGDTLKEVRLVQQGHERSINGLSRAVDFSLTFG